MKLAADFSTETLQARKKLQNILQVMKSKGLQPGLLYPESFTFKWKAKKGESHKRRLKEYTSTKPTLQDMLSRLL